MLQGREPNYTICAGMVEEDNGGWVWIQDPHLPSRTLVQLSRSLRGRTWKTFCEARFIDPNFIRRYSKDGRVNLTEQVNPIVISEWYRNALGGFPTAAQQKAKSDDRPIPDLKIRKLRLWGWRALRGACHHPEMGVRVGTRLGVLGVWLGVGAIVEPISKIVDPLWERFRDHIPQAYLDAANGAYPEVDPTVAVMVVTGIIALVGCRGPRRPRA